MEAHRLNSRGLVSLLTVAFITGCSATPGATDGSNNGDAQVDGRTGIDGTTGGDVVGGDTATTDTGSTVTCNDEDGDGISDSIEGKFSVPPIDTDHDGTPDYQDADSDEDGISDLDEGVRRYPGFESSALAPLACGIQPAHCSLTSTISNWRNLDSDSDGLPDHDEATTYHTDPCNPTTHTDPATGQPVNDVVWAAAGGMAPATGSLYVVLPYFDPSCGAAPDHVHRQFDFATRFHAADIFFVVDTTGSMGGTIDTLRTTLSSRIIPGIISAIGVGADVRFGAADYRSFPESPNGAPGSDYIVHVGQRLTRSAASVQGFINTMVAGGGGDYAEPMTEAVWQVFVGDGLPLIPGHLTDGTVQHGCMISGFSSVCSAPDLGWAQPMDAGRDCGDGPDSTPSNGFGCFQRGRVPIIVGFSDAQWVHDLHDRCDGSVTTGPLCSTFTASYARGGHTFDQLANRLTAAGAYFVGVDVASGDTHANALEMARRTGTLDGSGMPIAPMGAPTAIADIVISSVATLAGSTRQDVTRRIDATPSTTIVAGHTAADFISAVTPVRGFPGMPVGYDRSDATTFYGVNPSTIVTFDVDFFNSFQPPGDALQLFQATIVVLGRAGTELDRHAVYIVVPPNSCIAPG